MFNRLATHIKAALSISVIASLINNVLVASQETSSSTGGMPKPNSTFTEIDDAITFLILAGLAAAACVLCRNKNLRERCGESNNLPGESEMIGAGAGAGIDGEDTMRYARMTTP